MILEIILLRIFYLIYFLGIALFIYHALSRMLFSSGGFLKKLAALGKEIAFSVVWPLALFSKDGRKKLSQFGRTF